MSMIFRGAMGPASQSLVLFIVFCFITTGTVSQNSHLNVTILSSKPTFGIVGQPKTILCQVSGTVLTTVTWYFNGTRLSISSKYSWTQRLVGGRADLTISVLLKSDSGLYNCSVRNDAVTVSESTILSVEEILHVTVHSGTETGIVGQVKTLRCNVAGMPITSVQWSVNNNTLVNNEMKYYWDTSSTPNLYFESLTIADTGMYTCSATNHAGTDFASINLSVVATPMVTIKNSRDLSVNEGGNVLISCAITDTTTIDSLQWYFNNKFLYHSDPHYFWSCINGMKVPFDGSLRIYNVTPQDTGTYRCQATNIAGASEDSIHLKIVPKANGNAVELISVKEIGLIVLGSLLAICIIVIIILACCLRRKKERKKTTTRMESSMISHDQS
ncbi:hypothetical protein CHS0354_031172 [Potamilus streckersoni]|uniref:Ig-like domain-containing protein n=1 Tax=Potamilus streckersoni TaxID=2493646 RepID=A0AAE0WEA3_9BIVA|nr:hypothetical protein CHS0354_031172 [Potamilus streckersoni]